MLLGLMAMSFVCLFSIVLSCNYKIPLLTNIRLSIVETALLGSLLILAFTEGMSACNALTKMNTIVLWGVSFLFFLGVFLAKYKQQFGQISCNYVHIGVNEKILVALALLFIILPLLFIAFYYPPNDGDSLWYHLPRIEHWIANGNVNHYRALCPNQLYHQPFAEFILLHLRLLSGGDLFFNFLQFLAMIFSLITVTLVVQLWGLNYRFQLLAAILTLSIPMGIMQATSTQTDYVAAFYCIAFIYFGLRLIMDADYHYLNTIFAAISLGFGLLTKMIVAFYGLPFGLLFVLYYARDRKRDFWKLGLLVVAIIGAINSSFYVRNYLYTGTLVGSAELSHVMINETLTVPFFLSNVVRGGVLHFFLPSDFYLSKLLALVKGFHAHVLHIGALEQQISLEGGVFRAWFFMDDDHIGSFMLAFFIIAMMLYCCLHWRRLKGRGHLFLWYVVALCIGFFILSAVFKWQMGYVRFILPLAVASVPAITYFLHDLYKNGSSLARRFFLIMFFLWFGLFSLPYSWNYNNVHKRVFAVLLLGSVGFLIITRLMRSNKRLYGQPFVLSYFIIVSSLPFVFFNTKRPLLLNKPAFLGSREDKYFIGFWSDEYRRQYQEGADILYGLGLSTVATDVSASEYTLWALLQHRFQQYEVVPYTHSQIPKFQKSCRYRAILTGSDTTINSYKQEDIQFYKVLGPQTPKGNLKLIILKQYETITM